MARFFTRSLALACLCSCATASGPTETAEAYARALDEGRLDEAARLSDAPAEVLAARYPDPESRRERAREIRAAAPRLSATAPGLRIEHAPDAGWRVIDAPWVSAGKGGGPEGEGASHGDGGGTDGQRARATLERFVTAAEQGDFAAAYALLSSTLRARYTPERLARDFSDEPLARERLARARSSLSVPPELHDRQARFPIGEGRAVRLIEEREGWRVEALE